MYQNLRRLGVKRSLKMNLISTGPTTTRLYKDSRHSFTNDYDYSHHRGIQRKRWIGTSSKLLIIGVYYYSLQLGLLSLVLLVVDATTPFVVSKCHVRQKRLSPRSFTSVSTGFITTSSCRIRSSSNFSRHQQQFKKKWQTNGLRSIGLSTTSRLVQRNETSTNSSSSPSASSSRRIVQSAFGKAAIGKKNQNNRIINSDFESLPSLSFPPFPQQQDDDGREQVDLKQTNNGGGVDDNDDDGIRALPQDPKSRLQRRDEALVALKTHLNLSLKTSIDILNAHPRLYTLLPSLHSKLLYLKNDINLKPKQLTKMLTSHPRLFEAVLLDSEDSIASTMNVLQTELDLTPDDIRTIQSQSLPAILTYPRSELRKRILVYKLDLQYPKDQLQKLIWNDARILRTDSQNVRQVLKVLNEELGMEQSDVHSMLRKEILLLTYKANENILPTILYLKQGSIGRCLGMVERKGVSTLLVDSSSSTNECEDIIKTRLKRLILGHPKILSSSVEKNLKLTVSFFLDEVGLTEYEFGRVIYRRGGSLLEANVERTLRRKVEFLREKLGLELQLLEDVNGVDDGIDDSSNMSIPVPSSKRTKPLSNHEKRRLLAQMIATNPDILTLSIENNLLPKFNYFTTTTSDTDTDMDDTTTNGIGFSLEQLQHVLLKRPQILSLSLERNIIPKIECFTNPRIVNDNDSDGKKECGLGMKMKDVRDWVAEYPQMLTYVLDSRIKPRVNDAVDLGLLVGKNDDVETDDGLPLNFIICSDRSWSSWLDDHKLRESVGD